MELAARVRQLMNGESYCPECGSEVKTKTSFKGRTHYRNKRSTQYCLSCKWTCILPTEREAYIQLEII